MEHGRNVLVLSGVRTAIGKYGGGLPGMLLPRVLHAARSLPERAASQPAHR